MVTPIRVLVLEDEPADAELMVAELRRADFEPEWHRVDSEAEFLAHLGPHVDVILSDYAMPQWNALAALHLLQESGLNIPFIVVSGILGDEAAAECITFGATDYVLKDRMARLGMAVTRALEQKQTLDEMRQAEETLKESQQWLSTTLRSIGDGVIATDARGLVTFMNPTAESLTGWAEDDAKGQPLEDVFNIINEQTGEKVETPVERILRECVVVGLANHTALVARDGTTRPIRDSGAPIVTDQGITGTVLVFRDATEQKNAEAVLTRRTHELEALVAMGGLGAESSSFEQKAGRALEILVSAVEGYRATLRMVNKEQQSLRRVAAAGPGLPEAALQTPSEIPWDSGFSGEIFTRNETLVLDDYPRDARRLFGSRYEIVPDVGSRLGVPVRSGEEVVGALSISCTATNHFSPERVQVVSAIARGLGVAFDKANSEAALRESEERFRAIFESSPVGIGLGDLEQRILDVNEAFCQMVGYSKQELIGSRIADITHPEDIDLSLEPIEQVLRGEIPSYQVEKRYIAKDKRVIWARVSGSAVRGNDARPMYALSVMEDITERKHIESELQTRTQQLESFAQQQVNRMEADRREIALELHDEVGQQLTGLALALERGRSGDGADVSASLIEASNIVDNLMTMVRGLANRLRPGVLDDLGLLPAIIWLLDDFLAHSGLRVEFRHIGTDRRFPPGVETAVYRIAQEALTNVVRHSGVNEATVLLWANDKTIRLQVEDKGLGIDLDSLQDSHQSIGLSGIRERVAAVNGQFTLESTAGTGTRLIVELPFRDA